MPLFSYTTLQPATGASVTIDSGKPTLAKAFRDIRAYCKRNGYPLPSKDQIIDEATVAKPTLGPWEDNGNGLIYGQVQGDDDEAPFVADVCKNGAGGFYSDQEQANARLIAAAPELLDALEELLSERLRPAPSLPFTERDVQRIQIAEKKARDIITKATGKASRRKAA